MSQLLVDSLTINRLSPALGAEVLGLDASRPFDAATVMRLRAAFQEHHLLCFRDQTLSDDELTAFSIQFGPLEAFPEKDKTKGKIEVYNVANVSPEGEHLPAHDPRVIFQRNNARWQRSSDVATTASCNFYQRVLLALSRHCRSRRRSKQVRRKTKQDSR